MTLSGFKVETEFINDVTWLQLVFKIFDLDHGTSDGGHTS